MPGTVVETIVLKPLGDADPARRAASARAAAEALVRRDVRTGDVVTAQGISYVARRIGPRGATRTDPDRTVVEFDFSPDPPRRAVADVVFLLDTSWSMRRGDLAPTRLEAVKRALTTALANSDDVVRRAAVASFTSSAALAAPFAPPASVDLPAVDALATRGPGDVPAALAFALDLLAHEADPADEPAIFLATDANAPQPQLVECAARASRLGVTVHVLDAGSNRPAVLERLAADTDGTYHEARSGATFRPALQKLASRFGVPLGWNDPFRDGGEAEFEVVLRAMTERESGEFPAVPRRLRRK